MIWLSVALASPPQDVAWQTARMACEAGDPAGCVEMGDVEQACALGLETACIEAWSERPLRGWEAVYLWELCGTDPTACPLLEEAGWTLPFRRLAPSAEPVFAGPSEVLDGGLILVSPQGRTASVWNPETGEHVATFHHPMGRIPSQKMHRAEADGIEAVLTPDELTIRRDDEVVAVVHGDLPFAPILVDRGRVIVGGRMVFDVDPQPVDGQAALAWIAKASAPPEAVAPEPQPSGDLRVEVGARKVPVRLYDDGDIRAPIAQAVTNRSGVVVFPDVPAGRYRVSAASADGGGLDTVRTVGHTTARLSLDPTDVIGGRVIADGRPVPGARVYVAHPDVPTVTTDARGRFALPIWLDEDSWVHVWAETDDGLTHAAKAGPTDSVELEWVPKTSPSVLHVQLVGAAGEPLDGYLYARIGGVEHRPGPDGNIWVVREGTVPVVAGSLSQRIRQDVDPDQRTFVAAFDSATLAVDMTTFDPRGDARLTVRYPDGRLHGLGWDSSGVARLGRLTAGEYVLALSQPTGVQTLTLDVEPGQKVQIAPPFPWATPVSGRLVDSSGQPWIGVRMTVELPQLGAVRVQTDLDGRFEVDGLPPGEHEIQLAQRTARGWLHLDALTVQVSEQPVVLGDVPVDPR